MELSSITPLILTYNEEANLGRTLGRLAWARQVLVLDSFSTDATLSICAQHPNVRVEQRRFDSFAGQCNYGLGLVETPWVLSLDADYVCPPGLAHELTALPDEPAEAGFEASFRYCIYGRPLRGTLYPARTVLYRRDAAHYEQDGHAHRVRVRGAVGRLRSRIDHDDRKPLQAWFDAQRRYAQQEADKLLATAPAELGLNDRIRLRTPLAPLLAPAYALLVKGGALDGRAGLFYAMQRSFAETALALALYERRHAPRPVLPVSSTPPPIPT